MKHLFTTLRHLLPVGLFALTLSTSLVFAEPTLSSDAEQYTSKSLTPYIREGFIDEETETFLGNLNDAQAIESLNAMGVPSPLYLGVDNVHTALRIRYQMAANIKLWSCDRIFMDGRTIRFLNLGTSIYAITFSDFSLHQNETTAVLSTNGLSLTFPTIHISDIMHKLKYCGS